ncbi:MAG: hypothetical protein GY903_29285 [Fuerstiella sp.]|nr:hypothetical protein [Fuerstiella sp.]MCP4858591.1 hypothetical protein [Fuerstiella sp.]
MKQDSGACIVPDVIEGLFGAGPFFDQIARFATGMYSLKHVHQTGVSGLSISHNPNWISQQMHTFRNYQTSSRTTRNGDISLYR